MYYHDYSVLQNVLMCSVTVSLNQAGARAACRSDGKELLSLASIEEYETVKGMIQVCCIDNNVYNSQ